MEDLTKRSLAMIAALCASVMLTVSAFAAAPASSKAPAPIRQSQATTLPSGAAGTGLQSSGDLVQLAQRRRGARRGARRGVQRGVRRGRPGVRGPRARRRVLRRRNRRGRRAARRAIGRAAGIILGTIIAKGVRARGRRSAWEECDDRYRTFRWSDGTYIPYVGSDRVLCPLLR